MAAIANFLSRPLPNTSLSTNLHLPVITIPSFLRTTFSTPPIAVLCGSSKDRLFWPEPPLLPLARRRNPRTSVSRRFTVLRLIDAHKADGKLLVLDVGLKHCGPCVKVYPTVLKLSRQMVDTVVFARMNGDENQSCMSFLRDMDVIEVPTFLFIRDGEISGRYVGSGKGELIGEILRYQGVRVTY